MNSLTLFLWIVASAYTGLSIIRPSRPFRARWQPAVAFVVVQLACGIAALPGAPAQSTPMASQAAPVATTAPPEDNGPEVTLVKIDPNAPDMPISAAAREDAAKARSEMKTQLRLIDAAETLLGSGLDAGNREAIELVRHDMQQLDVKLIQRRPPLGGDPWPARAEEGHLACGTAAQRLGVIAAAALQATTLEGVAARQQFGRDYIDAHDKCSAWVRNG